MRRTGIDLSPTGCLVVDVETPGGRRKDASARSLRVRNFASFTHAGSTHVLTSKLRALAELKSFPRRAWVNVWDVASSHQYLLLPAAGQTELESTARHRGASILGLQDAAVTLATVIGATRGKAGHEKTELSFFAAGSEAVRHRLRPILDAGFIVDGVTTPCGALWSQARLRPAGSGEVHAYVAVGSTMSALAIFSNDCLLYARDLNWGHAGSPLSSPAPGDRESLAGRLAVDLRRSFLYLKQFWEEDVSQVFLCGDMPEVRSLAAPLIDRLNIDVEALDTLEGIDTTSLPSGFAEEAAALRLACAVASAPPPANLLPLDMRARPAGGAPLKVFAAGTAAAVACAAFLYGQASVNRLEAERLLAIAQRPRTLTLPLVMPDGPRIAQLVQAVSEASRSGAAVKSVRAVSVAGDWHISIDAVSGGRLQEALKTAGFVVNQ